jgi:hypothetical protein
VPPDAPLLLWDKFKRTYVPEKGTTKSFSIAIGAFHPFFCLDCFEVQPDTAAFFEVFDVDGKGEVDVLEVIITIMITSLMSDTEKLNFAFQCYNFENKDAMSVEEVQTTLEMLLLGWCKASGCSGCVSSQVDAVANESFGADVSSVDCACFVEGVLRSATGSSFLKSCRPSTPNNHVRGGGAIERCGDNMEIEELQEPLEEVMQEPLEEVIADMSIVESMDAPCVLGLNAQHPGDVMRRTSDIEDDIDDFEDAGREGREGSREGREGREGPAVDEGVELYEGGGGERREGYSGEVVGAGDVAEEEGLEAYAYEDEWDGECGECDVEEELEAVSMKKGVRSGHNFYFVTATFERELVQYTHALCTIHYTVHHTLYTIHYTPYTIHRTLHTIHRTLYLLAHRTLCTNGAVIMLSPQDVLCYVALNAMTHEKLTLKLTSAEALAMLPSCKAKHGSQAWLVECASLVGHLEVRQQEDGETALLPRMGSL